MKLMIAIINPAIYEGLTQRLISKGFRITSQSTVGGFFQEGNKTIWSCMQDDEVQIAANIIKEYTERVKLERIKDLPDMSPPPQEGMATVFFLPVERQLSF